MNQPGDHAARHSQPWGSQSGEDIDAVRPPESGNGGDGQAPPGWRRDADADVAALRESLERGDLHDLEAKDLDPEFANLSSAELLVKIVLADWAHHSEMPPDYRDHPHSVACRESLTQQIARIRQRLPHARGQRSDGTSC